MNDRVEVVFHHSKRKNNMIFSNVLSHFRPGIVAGVFLIALCSFFSCKEDPMPDTGANNPPPDTTMVNNPPPSLLDSIFGEHTGVCYYYRKQLDTGVETFDTTFGSIIDIQRVDSTWIRATGCASPGSSAPWHLPVGSADTLYMFSTYYGSNHYTMNIDLIERTITTSYYFTAVPFAPWFEKYDGKWEF